MNPTIPIINRANEPKPTTPEEFKARMIADVAKWTAVVDSTNFERI